MREPYERIAGGPFRDDTHRAAVEATAVDLAKTELPGNPRQFAKASADPVDGKIEADGMVMRVEVEDGRVRAAQSLGPYLTGATVTFQHPRGDKATVGIIEVMEAARQVVGRIYDDLQTVMASAGPLPLASSEPYSEENGEFSLRIGAPVPVAIAAEDVTAYLDGKGKKLGLPRARLVPATTKEGM
jgi:hypothetical protein